MRLADSSSEAPERPRSLDENEAQLEGVILLIGRRRLSQLFSLIFRHKPELIAHPQVQIGCDTIHLIPVLISRWIEPVDPYSRMCEVVYHRHSGLGVRAEAGKSTSRRNVVPPALNAPKQRQPLRDRIAGVERNALEIVLEGSVRLKRPVWV